MILQQFKRILLLIITFTITFGVIYGEEQQKPPTVAKKFADVKDDFWAKSAIDYWSSRGIIKGNGNQFNPNGRITRAQMLVILKGIFGYNKTAENPFYDLNKNDWYYDAVINAYANGIIIGSLDKENNRLACPNNSVTRAEAAVIFAKVFSIKQNHNNKTMFKDNNIPNWAKKSILGMEAAGYIKGKDTGLFDPSGFMTRAEAVQILCNIINLYINNSGTYSVDVNGNVVVSSADIILQNMKISGNLYLSEGIDEGSLTLENVQVTGSTIIRGGGADKIKITGCEFGNVIVEKDSIELAKLIENKSNLSLQKNPDIMDNKKTTDNQQNTDNDNMTNGGTVIDNKTIMPPNITPNHTSINPKATPKNNKVDDTTDNGGDIIDY